MADIGQAPVALQRGWWNYQAQRVKRCARRLTAEALRLPLRLQRSREVSAMIRVKNEQQFLEAAARSIIDWVDEIVFIDNGSTDGSTEIQRRLAQEYPRKVRLYQYPHAIARRGNEHRELASTRVGRRSPHLSSNYYNWCLARCRGPYVLKWDGDMIATATFASAMERWHESGLAALAFKGANVHPDRQHLMGRLPGYEEELQSHLSGIGVPSWLVEASYAAAEWRLFPRLGAHFTTGVWWTQTLSSPYTVWYHQPYLGLKVDEACFLHMRFCKDDPMAGYSEDFAQAVHAGLTTGPELKPEWRDVLDRWCL